MLQKCGQSAARNAHSAHRLSPAYLCVFCSASRATSPLGTSFSTSFSTSTSTSTSTCTLHFHFHFHDNQFVSRRPTLRPLLRVPSRRAAKLAPAGQSLGSGRGASASGLRQSLARGGQRRAQVCNFFKHLAERPASSWLLSGRSLSCNLQVASSSSQLATGPKDSDCQSECEMRNLQLASAEKWPEDGQL